jgi:hypothetical protein
MPDENPRSFDPADARARCEKASPGPWKCWNGWGPIEDGRMAMERIGPDAWEGGIEPSGDCPDLYARQEDAEFIASARIDLPDALDEIDRLSQQLVDDAAAFNEAHEVGCVALDFLRQIMGQEKTTGEIYKPLLRFLDDPTGYVRQLAGNSYD